MPQTGSRTVAAACGVMVVAGMVMAGVIVTAAAAGAVFDWSLSLVGHRFAPTPLATYTL